MHKKLNSPPLSRAEWDKEAWRVRRNEERLNFKKEISGRDWVLTRVFRLSILSLGKKCGEGLWMCLVWYEIQMLYMYRIGIVLFGIAVLTLR